MGIFSQDSTKVNQTSYNQQQGISTRDISGAQLTSGGGSVTSFGSQGLSVGGGGSSAIYTQAGGLSVGGGGSSLIGQGASSNTITVNNSLDATALDTAANLINNALASNTQTTQSALQGFQNALSASSEQPVNSASGISGGGVSPLPTIGGTPIGNGVFNTHDLVIFGAVVVVGAVLFLGYKRFHGR